MLSWFQNLGLEVISFWEKVKLMFLTQFQEAVKSLHSMTILAKVK